MKLIKTLVALLLTTALLVSPAHSVFYCETSVLRLLVYADGSVNVLTTARGDYTIICNVAEPRQGVDITTCAAWVSILQSVKRRNGVAIFYYVGNGTCAALPTYSASPAPYYVGDATP